MRGDFVIGSSRKERVSILNANGPLFGIAFAKMQHHPKKTGTILVPFIMNGISHFTFLGY
jgi:hypothetical protein